MHTIEDHLCQAKHSLIHAADYFGMAWATRNADPSMSKMWEREGRLMFEAAAPLLGYKLTPLRTPAEDHAAMLAARVAENRKEIAVTEVAADDRDTIPFGR